MFVWYKIFIKNTRTYRKAKKNYIRDEILDIEDQFTIKRDEQFTEKEI